MTTVRSMTTGFMIRSPVTSPQRVVERDEAREDANVHAARTVALDYQRTHVIVLVVGPVDPELDRPARAGRLLEAGSAGHLEQVGSLRERVIVQVLGVIVVERVLHHQLPVALILVVVGADRFEVLATVLRDLVEVGDRGPEKLRQRLRAGIEAGEDMPMCCSKRGSGVSP